jgi:hypothetical protein
MNNEFVHSWQDTRMILHELEGLFTREDDLEDVSDIKKMKQEIANHGAIRLKDAKEIVKGMMSQLSSKANDINTMQQADHAGILKKITEKKNINSLQIDSLLKGIDAKKTDIEKMKKTSMGLQDRMKNYNVSTEMMDSRTAYAISLYAKMTNITWDYSADKDHLTGCVGNSNKKEFVKFDIDKNSLSEVELADQLWDLIEEGVLQ